jgi:hypothetical protein
VKIPIVTAECVPCKETNQSPSPPALSPIAIGAREYFLLCHEEMNQYKDKESIPSQKVESSAFLLIVNFLPSQGRSEVR